MNRLRDRIRNNTNRNYKKVLAYLLLFPIIAAGTLLFKPVTAVAFVANGQELNVKTQADTVDQFFENMGIQVSEDDYVNVPMSAEIEEDMKIEWIPACDITVAIDGAERTVTTCEPTVGEALEAEGITVTEDDIINPSLDTKVEEGMEVSIVKAFPITVNDGGQTTEIVTTPCTVEEFLAENNIVLNEFDVVTPALTEVLQPGMTVEISRINKYQVQEEVGIPYDTTVNKDATKYEDYHNVDVAGQDGLALNTYEVVEINGQVQQKNLISSTTTKEPVTQVETVGTNSYTSAPGEAFEVTATAYTIPEGQDVAYTATGMILTRNPNLKVIAVDPDVIPLGSKVWVEGYGVAIAADTGGAINGNKIDVFLPTEEECYAWGNKTVTVKIIE